MSKELAAIKLDCPVEIKLEDAKIQNIYTQEAYQLLKNWNLNLF